MVVIGLEMGLINKIREFLSQMGSDFAFIGNQYILGAGINLTFLFWQPQVATWGYSHSTPSGLCVLIFL
jgi:hypothetical protein